MAENKKDSFTFSDKIKNSKPAVNPFAKKGASKIGNNGKPKQTLFERSRRDAPFFVAAAAALLMLPFLYKYSGTVNDDVIVPPGSEDSVFDPERFGFSPSAEDPNNQIAQLAGRDPLSLIKGWGNPEEEQAEPVASYDRDGFDNESYTPTRRVDTPNYRQTAPVATRAAFQRQATQVGKLGREGLNLRGGGGVGSRFGGAQLKAAARQSSASRPRPGAKPVSLTPLRAAGSPSRSYFGQGAAAQARASRDAMGKANAAEALRDAMFAPVDRGRTGGIGEGLFASGGGPGKFDHNMDFKGIEPWWWDMMKQQEMKKWEWEYFLWRKNLVEPLIQALAKVLATFGSNLACCIISGNSDCDADTVLGGAPGEAKDGQCNGISSSEWASRVAQAKAEGQLFPFGSFPDSKEKCRRALGLADNVDVKFDKKQSVSRGHGFFGQRLACLGANIKRPGATDLRDRFNCEAISSTHNFELQATGKAAKWKNFYHAVVVKNHVPFQLADGSHYLCSAMSRNVNPETRSGMQDVESGASRKDNRVSRGTKGQQISTYLKTDSKNDPVIIDERTQGLLGTNDNDGCVIYVAEGKVFDWDNFKTETIALLQQLIRTDGRTEEAGQDWAEAGTKAEQAFAQLQLSFIEGYSMKQSLAQKEWVSTKTRRRSVKSGNIHRSNSVTRTGGMINADVLPMTYVDFESTYVLRRNSAKNDDSWREKNRNFADTYEGVDRSTRTTLANDGKENAIRTACRFGIFRLTAVPVTKNIPEIAADLNFNPNIHGEEGKNITVTATIPGLGTFTAEPSQKYKPTEDPSGQRTNHWVLSEEDTQKVRDYLAQQTEDHRGEEQTIDIQWNAEFKGSSSKDKTDYTEINEPEKEEIPPCEPEDAGEENGCEYEYICINGALDRSRKVLKDPNCKPKNCEDDLYVQTIGGCEYIRKCVDGHLSETIEKRDPNCQDTNCTEDIPAGLDKDGCEQVYKCIDGHKADTPTKVNPDCRKATKVHFFQKVSQIPSNPVDRTDIDVRLGQKSSSSQWGNCSLDQQIAAGSSFKRVIGKHPVLVADADVKKVMQMAKQIYDSRNADKNSTIEYNPNKVTVAELIDAMMILTADGTTRDIPMNAACMLGKTIGKQSIDPQKPLHPSGKVALDNMFGTFAAYMGPDSSFYPQLRTVFFDERGKQIDQNAIPDPRFYGCQGTKTIGVGPAYHYGHYNWNRKELHDQAPSKGGLQDDRAPYEQVLESGIWQGAPLKPIADAVDRQAQQRRLLWPRKESWLQLTGQEMTREQINSGASIDSKNRTNYKEAYNAIFNGRTPCGLNDEQISIDNVKAYLDAICQPGALSQKPKNHPASGFACSGQFKEDETVRKGYGRNENGIDEDLAE